MIKINNIKISLNEDKNNIKDKISKKLKLKNNDFEYTILKESLDARKSNDIHFVYQVLVKFKNLNKNNLNKILKDDKNISYYNCEESYYENNYLKKGTKKLNKPILVVGMGPSGLFAAKVLSDYGYKVLLIDMGKNIEERELDVNKFWKTGVLNENSNVQFGEGGAGTFSDGKLTSRSKDKRNRLVLDTFYKYGANEEILYKQKPHIGTDILKIIIKNIREDLIKKGVNVKFSTKFKDFTVENGNIKKVLLENLKENKEYFLEPSLVLLCIGHSERTTFNLLNSKDLDIISKPFAVGFRIEHLKENIDKAQYKENYKNIKLKSSEYFLTSKIDKYNKSAYTFCMCPGGFVVASSSEKNKLVTNGMSLSKRDNVNSNSALLVNVNEEDYGTGIFAGVKFQEKYEELAFKLGGGNYFAPVQKIGDFLKNKNSLENKNSVNLDISNLKVKPTYPIGYSFENLNKVYSKTITESLKEAIVSMDKKLKGFSEGDGILTGVETRTSSPLRIIRDKEQLHSLKIGNLYPVGEGSGYSGGIVSSAIDGVKVAEKIIETYTF